MYIQWFNAPNLVIQKRTGHGKFSSKIVQILMSCALVWKKSEKYSASLGIHFLTNFGQMHLKSVLSLKTVNKQLVVRISALRLGYASQTQCEIPYTLSIFSDLDETSYFNCEIRFLELILFTFSKNKNHQV